MQYRHCNIHPNSQHMSTLQFRCVQLDLARQMECVEFIENFIRLIAANGYNALELYLEDRIRTASYPYPEPWDSYSPDEVRHLADVARANGIELIPCVATLGHAERFLRFAPLAGMSEEREGRKTRFDLPPVNNQFCPTDPGFLPFITTYLGEVAELFDSRFFHVGLDEFFDYQLCSRCRDAMPDRESAAQFFLNLILELRNCLAAHGKELMMWSDMFEFYPELLAKLPSDIIVIDWQYQEDVRFYLGHLLDMDAEDRLRANHAAGLRTVMAPADLVFTNATSCLRFAQANNTFGFLLTMWERCDTYMYRSLPTICQCGRILNGQQPDEAWRSAVRDLCGTDDPLLPIAIRLAEIGSDCRHFSETWPLTLFCRPYAGLPLGDHTRARDAYDLLASLEHKPTTELGHRIWLDAMNQAEERLIQCELKEAFQDTFDFGYSPERAARAHNAAARFRAMLERKEAQWSSFRPGITPNFFTANKNDVLSQLDKNLASLEGKSMVRLRFMMPDQYGVSYVKIRVLDDSGHWHTLCEQEGAKADHTGDALFVWTCLVDTPEQPRELEIQSWGMGGRGMAYIEVRNPAGQPFVPSEILACSGLVEHPEHLLEDNANFTWFGDQSTRRAYDDEAMILARHTVRLKLKQK